MHNFVTQYVPYYENSLDPFKPEHWANASIAILEENMVAANLVHRDFDNEVAQFGDTVNTRKPSEFEAKRKTDTDDVTTQDISATNVQVVLNQWIHVSFIVRDGERTKSFKDLVRLYMAPAMSANARLLDQSVLAQAAQFLGNVEGGLGLLSESTAKNYLIDLGAKLDAQKVGLGGRNLVLSETSKAEILKAALFHEADKRGDGGQALRNASLGRAFGFDSFMDINTPKITAAEIRIASTVDGAVAAGVTTVTLDAASVVGEYVTVVGDSTPLRATNAALGMTVNRATKRAIADGAASAHYETQEVDLAAGYANGWTKEIHVDGANATPHVGQLVAFNDGDTATGTVRTPEYVITQVTNTAGNDYDILLDRPLETALVDDDAVCYGPVGDINLAFQRDAIALVNRPLSLPMAGTGARSANAGHNGMSMRVVITYDGVSQGHRVTIDGLFGVKVLDTDLGCVLLG